MRSARLLLALRGAGPHSSLRHSVSWRALSSAKNLFEIDLSALKSTIADKLTLDDVKRAAETQQADAQREINLLHDEMSNLFGEEIAEYGDATSNHEEVVAVFEQKRESEPVKVEKKEKKSIRAEIKSKKVKEVSHEPKLSEDRAVDVLLLQGPCSFVRDVWTGGDMKRKELETQIQVLTDELKIGVKSRNFDTEAIILRTLLEARENQVIILSWNISLSKSPFILHALELIRSRVIIVSPTNVEHGPLPENVVGVISGFWNQSLSLALKAAATFVKTNVDMNCSSNNGKEEPHQSKAKKKVITCFLCGEVGHIRSQCPQLPQN